MKVIVCNTPHGQYSVPLNVIAINRTEYYAQKDGFKKGSKDWDAEIEYVMEDNFEAIDWILNNMDWDDVKDKATKINDKVMVTDDDFFTSSDDFEIKEM